ncbi:DUF4340 domain-containing protein [Candidatus Sumerlaeota bacterium]|nr:DUF4340 domain-containing protein [Candidatus Sumerlaeota bacterium]
MKGKSVYIIALIAIILVVIVLLAEKPFQQSTEVESTPDSLKTIERLPVLEKVSSENAFKIQIFRGDGGTSTTLVKVDDQWFVNPERRYSASKNNTQRIFDALKDIKDGEVVSTNPENHVKFQVDGITSTRVKFFGKNNETLADVYVGKMGMNYMSPSNYIRNAGSDDVLSVEASLTYLFQVGDEAWRERTIFSHDPSSITSFTIREPGKSPIKIARMASDEWTCLEPDMFMIRKDIGNRMASSFARLQASSFVEDWPQKSFEEYGLDSDALSLTASLKDYSSTPTLYIGARNEDERNQWYVRAEGQETVYQIYQYARDSLVKTLEELKPTPTPTPTPESSPTEASLTEKVREETLKKAEDIQGMTEEEKQEAIQEKLDEIIEKADKDKKLKQTGESGEEIPASESEEK